ncbi:hypothetical protein A0H81_13884 [Grifola frondosa]|uniref:Uncharacterized protein n=1 Tax=Grifola frondosa TaxID=5627 RepID=A0A1C7LPK9_GRIFR|nr:hypothetical protein A0H81_13884 [Grifola frondosa]
MQHVLREDVKEDVDESLWEVLAVSDSGAPADKSYRDCHIADIQEHFWDVAHFSTICVCTTLPVRSVSASVL